MAKTNEKSGQGGLHRKPADGNPEAAPQATEAGSIDQIRDIIFGSQMKDYERRFQRLEERSQQRIEELHGEVGKRIDTIEAFVRKEIDAHGERLKSEQSARNDAVKTLSKEIGDSVRALTKSLEAQVEKQAREAREQRQQVMELSKSLSEEIRLKHGEASKSLNQAVRELDDAKVARTALADILLEMAVRLSDELAAKLGRAADKFKQ